MIGEIDLLSLDSFCFRSVLFVSPLGMPAALFLVDTEVSKQEVSVSEFPFSDHWIFVSMFGRETPVELELDQVELVEE